MVSTRTTIRLLIALGAAAAVLGNSDYYEELAARSIDVAASELEFFEREVVSNLSQQPYRRGFVDGDDFVLSARDLQSLGVRANDISHVLVVRAGGASLYPRASESDKKHYREQIAKFKKKRDEAKVEQKKWKDKAKAEKDSKKKAKYQEEAHSASEMVKYNEEEIEEFKKLLG
jgi:hypothetical protein